MDDKQIIENRIILYTQQLLQAQIGTARDNEFCLDTN